MSIPIDRLYQYIEGIAEENCNARLVIYRFWPNGSKKIEDFLHLKPLVTWYDNMIRPHLYCNDQEPLNFDLYQNSVRPNQSQFKALLDRHGFQRDTNFRLDFDIYDYSLLLHSEQRSQDLEKYQQKQFIPVYYWSHALISLDWFRFAKYVNQKKNISQKFLIYNRAWSGTREYRLKFAEQLIRYQLYPYCKTSLNPVEPELGVHYNDHVFKNTQWRPEIDLEKYFKISHAQSHYSADFDIEDYESTDIEIVLETLFDDNRMHLTEKTLRPIACGQPFVLMSPHGSLSYLKSYGFKTFDSLWDESYDHETDPQTRMIKILELMQEIKNWDMPTYKSKIQQARQIADYNKQHFFSNEFFNQVVTELKTNLCNGLEALQEKNTSTMWLERWNTFMSVDEIKNFVQLNTDTTHPTLEALNQVTEVAKKYNLRS